MTESNSDGDIIRACQKGSDDAFTQLVGRYQDKAFWVGYNLLGNTEEARDVAQEAFLKAYAALPRFRQDAQLSTWFYRILVNQASKYRRKRWVRDRYDSLVGHTPGRTAGSVSQAEGDPGLRRRIAMAIDRLPPGQRVAFALVHLEGLSVPEAAEVMQRAAGTVKSHLHRATQALRQELEDVMEP